MLGGGQINGGNSTVGRAEEDFYATDPTTTELFLNEFHKDNRLEGNILECACGQGHLAEVLKSHYPSNTVDAIDLIDRGYGEGNIDFLTYSPTKEYGTIITNPPFALVKEFIEKGLEISDRYVIMLCKIQLLEGAKRKELLQTTPLKYVYVHSKRQNTWKNGEPLHNGKKWSTVLCLAWFVWDKTYKGEPIIRWI